MSSNFEYDPNFQAMEEEVFGWRCVICSVLAFSPRHLEEQHMLYEFSVYDDIDGTPWVRCDACLHPFHLKCVTQEPEAAVRAKRFVCTFFGCNAH